MPLYVSVRVAMGGGIRFIKSDLIWLEGLLVIKYAGLDSMDLTQTQSTYQSRLEIINPS